MKLHRCSYLSLYPQPQRLRAPDGHLVGVKSAQPMPTLLGANQRRAHHPVSELFQHLVQLLQYPCWMLDYYQVCSTVLLGWANYE